jgi:hypothetical protein
VFLRKLFNLLPCLYVTPHSLCRNKTCNFYMNKRCTVNSLALRNHTIMTPLLMDYIPVPNTFSTGPKAIS